jgi:hypothetical protein
LASFALRASSCNQPADIVGELLLTCDAASDPLCAGAIECDFDRHILCRHGLAG